jgi:hypothetical protein
LIDVDAPKPAAHARYLQSLPVPPGCPAPSEGSDGEPINEGQLLVPGVFAKPRHG